MQSNFDFIDAEIKNIRAFAKQAEIKAKLDPRYACFQSRFTAETAVKWMYDVDRELRLPYNTMLGSLMSQQEFQRIAPIQVKRSLEVIKRYGNMAAHNDKPIATQDAVICVHQLHNFLFWLTRTYFEVDIESKFDSSIIPDGQTIQRKRAEIEKLAKEREEEQKKLEARLEEERANNKALQEALEKLKAQVAANKAEAEQVTDTHDYTEEQTRKALIDVLLKESGWHSGSKNFAEEYELDGVERNVDRTGKGFADYVLFDDNGLPLAVIEAKRTSKDAKEGKYQAVDYANALEKKFNQRPVIFYTNGYDHYIWDDHFYPERKVQGFYKKDELQVLIERRKTRETTLNPTINKATVERPYQTLAINAVTEHFEAKNQRRALVVMATGSGKTRTAIALVEVLQKANWVKRALFLCDRDSLVRQAKTAFKNHLPNTPAVDLRDKKSDNLARVCVSTYHTMMNLIDEFKDGQRLFSPGHFDLIIIDEAHRSIYQKFGAIFDYFDSLLLGLTATPRSEVDRNTYKLFNLESGIPVYGYELAEAIEEGYLLNYWKAPVSTRLSREGLKYSELSEAEKEDYELHFLDEETGELPEEIAKEAINKWLFNGPTVDKFLKDLMEKGLKVEGGDKLGKTIIFAKNIKHAAFIVERFDANYPEYKGKFCAQIDYSIKEDAHGIIEKFKIPESMPQIAVSVDMMDTGINVPSCLNLVFAKPVYSRVKFWQMIGRGTRRCDNLFGPDQHKECFYIFDCCDNFAFFEENEKGMEARMVEPLSKRIFRERLFLADKLKHTNEAEDENLRSSLNQQLHSYVSGMCKDNFLVRPHLRLVSKLSDKDAWFNLDDDTRAAVSKNISGLPSSTDLDDEYAKRWDYLLLKTQAALLDKEKVYEGLIKRIAQIAKKLEDKTTIPDVKKHLAFIQELQEKVFWEGMNLTMLEEIRKKLRLLVKYIDTKDKKIIYTDFEDELEQPSVFEPGTEAFADNDLAAYKQKMAAILKANEDEEVIWKIRCNRPLTDADLKQIDELLKLSTPEDRKMFKETFAKNCSSKSGSESPNLEMLIRSIVGLEREAVEKEFSDFLDKTNLTSQQQAFVRKVIDCFVQDGFVPAEVLYEAPFNAYDDLGPEHLFGDRAEALFAKLKELNGVEQGREQNKLYSDE